MDSDKFDSLLDLEDFSDIYASIYGDTDKDNTEATEQQPKTEYNNAATADKTASGADELFSMSSDAPDHSAEKPAVEEKKPPEPPAAEEISFDPRFNIDRNADGKRRREYTYGGKSISSERDAHYMPHVNPQYEELSSSYTGYDDSSDRYFTDESAADASSDEQPVKKKFSFFRRKEKQPPAPEFTGVDIPEQTEDAATGGLSSDLAIDLTDFTDETEGQAPSDGSDADLKEEKASDASGGKKSRKLHFNFQHFTKENDALTPEEERILASEDSDEESPATFGKFLSSRIAALALRLRGNVPLNSPTGSVAMEEEEDLGEEVTPMEASKYYSGQIYSLRLRTRLSAILWVILLYFGLDLPVPGMLGYLPVAVAACLAIQLTILFLSLDVVTNAITNLFRRKFGADTLAVLSCVFTSLDALAVLNAGNVYRHMPLFAVSSLSLIGVLLSSLLSARGMRKALRVPAIGKIVYSVTAETNVTGKDITILKSARPISGFVRRMEEAPIDEAAFQKISVFVFLLSFLLSLISAVLFRRFSDILYFFSSILASAVPFTALLGFALPFFVGSNRIFSSGAALAGWSGINDIGNSKNLIVTDRDIFPAENVEIENVRIFADYDADKVITYAGSLILASKCGLAPAFSKLMTENNCSPVRIDNLSFLAGGGIRGMAEGHSVLCGSSDVMRLMNVRIPYRLLTPTTALLAIDGVLYGIFNIKYTADPKVRKALVSLMRSNRHPIFAIRDFNITPEFIRDCFDVATDGYDFPPYTDRFPISEAKPSKDSQISAVVCREGLGPLTDVADTGRSIYVVSRLNTLISLLASVLGLLISFIRILSTGYLGIGTTVLLMVLFSLPVLVLGLFTTSVN